MRLGHLQHALIDHGAGDLVQSGADQEVTAGLIALDAVTSRYKEQYARHRLYFVGSDRHDRRIVSIHRDGFPATATRVRVVCLGNWRSPPDTITPNPACSLAIAAASAYVTAV